MMHNTNGMKESAMKRSASVALRPLLLAAGLSIGLGGLGSIAYAQSVETAKPAAPAAPAAPAKPAKRKVMVVGSGGGTVVEKDGKIIIRSEHGPVGAHGFRDEAREKALAEVQSALDEVNARLGKTKSKDERKALEAAVKGLETSIQTLKSMPALSGFRSFGNFTFDFDDDVTGAISELQLHEGELDGLRIELEGDLAEARAEIAEALAGLEIEVDRDGDLRRLRIRSLKDAELSLDGFEERHLEELKRAQDELARARADLERRIEERKTQRAKEKPDDK